MKNQSINNNKKMSEMLFWLDTWFQKTDELPDLDVQELIIYNQIKDNWNTRDRIEMFNSLKKTYKDQVKAVIEKVIKKNAIKDWQDIAASQKDNSLDSFIDTLWEPLKETGFVYTQEQTEQGIQFKCTECPIYDLAKEIDATEWIYELVCKGDYFMPVGFNPDIKFERDKTLMQGDKFCNHFYTTNKR